MELLGIVICLGMFMVAVSLPLLAIGALGSGDYRGVRRLIRERKFGLFSIFLAMAAIAITLGILRAIGADFTNPGTLCVGAFTLMVAVMIVGLFWLALSDRLERGESRKLQQKMHTPDIQVGPPAEPEILLGELVESGPVEAILADEIVPADLAEE